MPIILWFIFFFRIDLKKYLFICNLFSLYFITIYISGGRTSLFLWVITIIGSILVIKDLRKILLYSIIILIFFISTTSYFKLGKVNTFHRQFVKTYNQITNFEMNNEKIDVSTQNEKKKFKFYSTEHEGHILLALKLFDENKIFGIGPQGFKEYCRKVNHSPEIGICSTHPHNILIQIILLSGILGLFFYVISAVFVLYNFFISILKHRFNEEYLSFYSITLGLIINLFPLIPGGNFFQ